MNPLSVLKVLLLKINDSNFFRFLQSLLYFVEVWIREVILVPKIMAGADFIDLKDLGISMFRFTHMREASLLDTEF